MNVTELIELTNRLSTDKSELTPKERATYLQYLNMANDELYEIASSGYAPIINRKNLFPTFESPFYKGTTAFNYPDNFFKIDSTSFSSLFASASLSSCINLFILLFS